MLGIGATLANAADTGASLEQRVARLEQASQPAAPAINTGDNAWLLASCALVLMMTAPGLILFYGGLVRSKNVLSTMMHSLILMALVSTLWMLFGYSMAFAPGNAFVGNPFTYFHAEWSRRRAESRLLGHGAAAKFHAVSNDVRHHHAGAHQRRGRGTDPVQGLRPVHDALGHSRLFPAVPHGLGHGRLFQLGIDG